MVIVDILLGMAVVVLAFLGSKKAESTLLDRFNKKEEE